LKTKGLLFVMLLGLMVSVLVLNVSYAIKIWNIEKVTFTGEDDGYCSSLAFDSSGNPCISYGDGSHNTLLFSRWTGSGWTHELVDGSVNVAWETSLARSFFINNSPRISYYDATNGDLKYAAWSLTSGWTTETLDSTGDVGRHSSIFYDDLERCEIHVSYYDRTNGDLKYVLEDSSHVQIVDSTGNVGEFTSLALFYYPPIPGISYYDATNGNLKYAYKTGSFDWEIQIVDSTGNVGKHTSLAFDSDENPCISYYDVTNGDLKFAKQWFGFMWSTETVDSAGDVGQFTSLAFDSSGNPCISYYDATNGDLKFARRTGSGWSVETVDSAGTVGWYSSLAFDSGGNACISYYDHAEEDLMFAREETYTDLTLQDAQTWFWTGNTGVSSVARGDVDDDGQVEIVTGGSFNDGVNTAAQLCVWDGTTLTPENIRTWYWTSSTVINSVVVGDVDGDGKTEIVTGGRYFDGTRYVAQLCVWDGASLAFENVQTWWWTDDTVIESVAAGDVDGDGKIEIVTGGSFNDGSRNVAQLCVWDGASLAFENVQTWYWTSDTYIYSVGIGDVDSDAQAEIVTGGCYWDGSAYSGQLCVWSGATLAFEKVQSWLWGGITEVRSVAVGDVDSDGQAEIVTGGYYSNGAQLCTWNGATLALENVQTWLWGTYTYIRSVAVGDVDIDGKTEIVTGGYCSGGAQLCVWDGGSLTFENVQTWSWGSGITRIESVAVGNVDGDVAVEVATGGSFNDGTRNVAQLCVWEH
jgi:hypothetical protein